jgi:hypothetical protein
VASVVFMAFAGGVYAIQTSWKIKHDEVTLKLTASDAELSDMGKEFEQYKNTMKDELEEAQRAQKLSEADFKKAIVNLDLLKTSNEQLKKQHETQRNLAERMIEDAAQRRAEADQQKLVNEKLLTEQNRLNDVRRALENETFEREVELKQMLRKHLKVLAFLARARAKLIHEGFDPNPPALLPSQAPPPLVKGIVRAVERGRNGANALVEISIGSDDGIAKGHHLTVYRTRVDNGVRPKYLGEILIVDVKPDVAVGEVKLKTKNGNIQKGDNVTSKL